MTRLRKRLLCAVAIGLGASLLGGADAAIGALVLFPVGMALAYVIRPAVDGPPGSARQTL